MPLAAAAALTRLMGSRMRAMMMPTPGMRSSVSNHLGTRTCAAICSLAACQRSGGAGRAFECPAGIAAGSRLSQLAGELLARGKCCLRQHNTLRPFVQDRASFAQACGPGRQ